MFRKHKWTQLRPNTYRTNMKNQLQRNTLILFMFMIKLPYINIKKVQLIHYMIVGVFLGARKIAN
jgi:hypothetical protein